MAQWIETKLRYQKIMENGAVKKVTEPYLVDALSFAEAEARIIEEMKPYISGDFEVKAVKKAKIAEVFELDYDEDGKWWKIRAAFITLDERTESAKKTPHDYLIKAEEIREAIAGFQHEISMLADYEIISVVETPILDIFPAKLSGTE